MSITHLLYLHGFRSSPQSMKAQKVAARVRARHPGVTSWCPQLPPSPRAAMDQVMDGIADWPRDAMAVIGSSLGGFYAAWIARQTGCPAVLLNPAVHPARDLARHIGEQTGWHNPDDRFFFKPEFVEELRALAHELERGPQPAPGKAFAIIAKGDEVLDWREMAARCAGARIQLLESGDHALSDFDDHIDAVFTFLDLA
jgi:uncharacterized protein